MINRYAFTILALLFFSLPKTAWCSCLDGRSHLIQVNIVAPYAVELMLAGRWYSSSASASLNVQTVSVQVPFFDADYVLAIHVVGSPYLLVDVFIDGYLYAKTGNDITPVWDPSTHNSLAAPAAIKFTVSAIQPVSYGWWTDASVNSQDTWNSVTVASQNPGASFSSMNGQWVSYGSASGDCWWRLNVSPRYLVDFVVNSYYLSQPAINGKQFFSNGNSSTAYFFSHNTASWCQGSIVANHEVTSVGNTVQTSGLIYVNGVATRGTDSANWKVIGGLLNSLDWMSSLSMSTIGWSNPKTCVSTTGVPSSGLSSLFTSSSIQNQIISTTQGCSKSNSADNYYRTILPFPLSFMTSITGTGASSGVSNLLISAFVPTTATVGQYLRLQWNFVGRVEISAPGVLETLSSSIVNPSLQNSNQIMINMPVNSFSVSIHTVAPSGFSTGIDFLLSNELGKVIGGSSASWIVTSVQPNGPDWWSFATLGDQWVAPIVCGPVTAGFSGGLSNNWTPNASGNNNGCNGSATELWWQLNVVQSTTMFNSLQLTPQLNNSSPTSTSVLSTPSVAPPTPTSAASAPTNSASTPSVLTFFGQYFTLLVVLLVIFFLLLIFLCIVFLMRNHVQAMKKTMKSFLAQAQSQPQPALTYQFPTQLGHGDFDGIFGANMSGKSRMDLATSYNSPPSLALQMMSNRALSMAQQSSHYLQSLNETMPNAILNQYNTQMMPQRMSMARMSQMPIRSVANVSILDGQSQGESSAQYKTSGMALLQQMQQLNQMTEIARMAQSLQTSQFPQVTQISQFPQMTQMQQMNQTQQMSQILQMTLMDQMSQLTPPKPRNMIDGMQLLGESLKLDGAKEALQENQVPHVGQLDGSHAQAEVEPIVQKVPMNDPSATQMNQVVEAMFSRTLLDLNQKQ